MRSAILAIILLFACVSAEVRAGEPDSSLSRIEQLSRKLYNHRVVARGEKVYGYARDGSRITLRAIDTFAILQVLRGSYHGYTGRWLSMRDVNHEDKLYIPFTRMRAVDGAVLPTNPERGGDSSKEPDAKIVYREMMNIGCLSLPLLAIAFYTWRKRPDLVRPPWRRY